MKILYYIKNISKKKKIAVILLLIAFIFAANYFGSNSVSGDIQTARVERGEIIVSQTESGDLQASKNAIIAVTSRTRGGLQIIDMIDEGTEVKKGDTLVQFDTKNIEDLVKSREERLVALEEQLEKLEAQQASRREELYADLKTIKNNYELADLSVENMKYESENKRQEAKLQYDNAKLNYDDQIVKIKNQKIINRVDKNNVLVNIEEAKNNLEWAYNALENLTIRAPGPGLVVYKEHWTFGGYIKVKIGDNIHPYQPLIELPDLSEFQVRLKVNEIDVDKYEMGLEVNVTLDAYPERSFKGIVTEISPLVEGYMENLRLFNVIITLQEVSPMLRPGMTAKAEICLKKVSDALYVPVESVFEKNGKPVVFVKDSGYKLREVTIGERNENFIIIKDNLREGDEIALIDPTGKTERLGTTRERELRLQRRKEIIERFVDESTTPVSDKKEDERERRPGRKNERFNPDQESPEVIGAYLKRLLQNPEIKKEYDKRIKDDPEFEKDSEKKVRFYMEMLQKTREKDRKKE